MPLEPRADMNDDRERLTFRLTTGQEILIGFREAPRQKRDRKRDVAVKAECERFGGVGESPSEAAAREVIEHRREATLNAWAKHPPECRCDDCVPF